MFVVAAVIFVFLFCFVSPSCCDCFLLRPVVAEKDDDVVEEEEEEEEGEPNPNLLLLLLTLLFELLLLPFVFVFVPKEKVDWFDWLL